MNAFTLIGFKCMLSNVCQSNMSSKPWIIIWLSQLPIYAGFQSFWRILLGVLPEGMQLLYQWLWRPLCQRSLKLLWRWRLRPHQGRPKQWPSKGSAPSADHPSTASRAAGVEKTVRLWNSAWLLVQSFTYDSSLPLLTCFRPDTCFILSWQV